MFSLTEVVHSFHVLDTFLYMPQMGSWFFLLKFRSLFWNISDSYWVCSYFSNVSIPSIINSRYLLPPVCSTCVLFSFYNCMHHFFAHFSIYSPISCNWSLLLPVCRKCTRDLHFISLFIILLYINISEILSPSNIQWQLCKLNI